MPTSNPADAVREALVELERQMLREYGISAQLGSALNRVYDRLAALAGAAPEMLSESDKDVALAQAVEFSEYVERQAKGAMADAARRFLSLPYSQEIAGRLTHAPAKAREDDARDARRYRLIRDHSMGGWIEMPPGHGLLNCDEPEGAWDDTIDAALATFAEGDSE